MLSRTNARSEWFGGSFGADKNRTLVHRAETRRKWAATRTARFELTTTVYPVDEPEGESGNLIPTDREMNRCDIIDEKILRLHIHLGHVSAETMARLFNQGG